MSDLLDKFHASLREAGIEPPDPSVTKPSADAQDAQPNPADTPVPDAPTSDDALATPAPTRFPSNTHRFNFAQGESVSFFDESGQIQHGQIAGPAVSDRYPVVGTGGKQTQVLKSELFYDQGSEPDQAAPAGAPPGQSSPGTQ